MSKPERTKAQRLLSLMETKVTELQNEINQMEAKKECPFWFDFSKEVNTCVYIQSNHKCESFETCPGNGDAWCYRQIGAGVKEKKESKIVDDIKKICEKYADLRCNGCGIAET